MDIPNVNNLDGVPNFGHGFPEDEVGIGSTDEQNEPTAGETVIPETPVDTTDLNASTEPVVVEVEEPTEEVEEKPKKKKE